MKKKPTPLQGIPITLKTYQCLRCGYITDLATNHTNPVASSERYNACPRCVPADKFRECGGRTQWVFLSETNNLKNDKITNKRHNAVCQKKMVIQS